MPRLNFKRPNATSVTLGEFPSGSYRNYIEPQKACLTASGVARLISEGEGGGRQAPTFFDLFFFKKVSVLVH